MSTTVLERFWSKVLVIDEECWLWQGTLHKGGYGLLGIGRDGGTSRLIYAHRLSYQIAYGPISGPWEIRHTCDNRPCVNPHHLLIGTRQDNTDDMTSRGRQARGETNGRHRFTEQDVRHMRELREQGWPYTKIGKLYGCHRATARKCVKLRWQHL